MHIVLRKVGGRFTPLWQSRGGGSLTFSAAGASPLPLVSAFGWLALAVIVLAVLAWLVTHGSLHASALPFGAFGVAGMTDSAALKEKREKLAAKAKLWGEADAASLVDGKRDMSQKPLLEKLGVENADQAKSMIDALYFEIEELNADIDEMHHAEMKSGVQRVTEDLKRPLRVVLPSSGRSGHEQQTFGQMVVDSKEFKGRGRREQLAVEIDIDLKTLLQTSAGWQPRTGNGDRFVDKIIRPVQILDRIPTDSTDLFEIPFMLETTRTQAAAELAEAGTYAEDAFVFARQTSAVRKIGSQIPVTDEQLADVGSMRSLLDNRLRFGLEARLDQQIMVGDGISPNLQGVFTASGIQTQAKGADSTANAIFKAMTLVRITGRAIPDTIAMHGTDWANVRLAQNAQGDYQFGPPTMVGADTMWGLPVAQTEALTAGNAVVGAFTTYSQLLYKKGIEVQAGWIGSQFIEGKMTLRADLRAAFVIYRGAAFAKVTGL
jgi:hypothetical protein